MKKRFKKGFTLIELLVVIGILAVLAVVSVVGYFGFIKKAQVSNDVSLTTQMNTILQASEAGGETFATPHDAVEALEDGGLDVTKLTPTTDGYNYIYDSVNHKMILVEESNGNFNVRAPEGSSVDSSKKENYFVFVSTAEEVTKYSTSTETGGWSVYLKDGYADDTAYVSTSIDAGNNLNLKVINYTNTNENVSSIIRSNSTSTTVNVYAPNGVIKHYGEAKEVNIAEVAMSSYHENGTVLGNINVAKGNVEIESTASVSNVVIKEVEQPKTSKDDKTEAKKVTPESGKVTVEVKENAEVSTVQSKSEAVKTDDVVSGSGSSEVAKIENNDNNVAYIGKTGYSSFDNALKAAIDDKNSNKSTILLMKSDNLTYSNYDVSNTDKGIKFENKTLTIDLNSCTLTYKKGSDNKAIKGFYINNASSLTIKNGKIEAKEMGTYETAVFRPDENSSVYAYNVEFTTNGCGFFPKTGSKVHIESSKVIGGGYVVGTTNGSGGGEYVDITIKNCDLSTTGNNNDGDDNTVMINVPGTLQVSNSTITGHRVALCVRAGTANISNTTISSDLSYNKNDLDINGNWGSNPNLPKYPVIIGDTNSNYYNADAICTFNNVTVSNTSTGSYKDRCVCLANDGKYATTFTYDSASTVSKYEVRNGSTVTVNGKSVVGA